MAEDDAESRLGRVRSGMTPGRFVLLMILVVAVPFVIATIFSRGASRAQDLENSFPRVVSRENHGSRFTDVTCRNVGGGIYRCTGNYKPTIREIRDEEGPGLVISAARYEQQQETGITTFEINYNDVPAGSAYTFRRAL